MEGSVRLFLEECDSPQVSSKVCGDRFKVAEVCTRECKSLMIPPILVASWTPL